MLLFFGICFAYLIGAIPTGYLFSYFYSTLDIRRHGSGNIGASNVGRLFGLWAFLSVFLLDAGKSYLCISFLKKLAYDHHSLLLCALVVLFGNMYSVFLRGDGGKGVATYIGLIMALQGYETVLSMSFAWLVIVGVTKRPAYASLSIVWSLLLYKSIYLVDFYQALFLFSCASLITWRHKSNFMGTAK